MDLGTFQSKLSDLPSLSNLRYENIFKLYKNSDNQYFYNILSTVSFPPDLDQNIFYNIAINEKTPWPLISYSAYGTIELWWLIAIINNVKNPLVVPANQILKILKPEYVRPVIMQLDQLIQ